MILGIDEAGRGPWAGPLVVGAVVLGGKQISGLTDSKKLSKKKRELLYDEIISESLAHATGWVSASELDDIGMSNALRLATRRAVEKIAAPYSEIIIDGTVNFLRETGKGSYVQTMPKADLLIPSVSAASIIAKVERDRYMSILDTRFPGYGFGAHAGYGVSKHRLAIDALGVTPEHRLSFAPLASYRPENFKSLSSIPEVIKIRENSKKIGDDAESSVVDSLERDGHEIIERNWRTKFCEIDIVSKKDETVYFVEVKYRRNDKAGDGLAVITPKKLKQMYYAARIYAHSNKLQDTNLRLLAVAVTDVPPRITSIVEVN